MEEAGRVVACCFYLAQGAQHVVKFGALRVDARAHAARVRSGRAATGGSGGTVHSGACSGTGAFAPGGSVWRRA